MASYGVNTTNMFELLEDDDGPTDGDNKKKSKAKQQQQAADDTTNSQQQQQQPLKVRTKVEDRFKPGGSQRGRGGVAAPRGRQQPRPGKRQFDRRGGPDSYDRGQARKDGLGLGKPGEIFNSQPTDEFASNRDQAVPDEQQPSENGAQPSTTQADGAAPVEGADASAPIDPAAPKEKDQLTYDEYLTQLKAKQVEDDKKISVRAPQNDPKQWKAAKPLKKNDDDANEDENQDDDDNESGSGKRKGKKAISLDEFVKETNDRGGFRGRGRGGRGRGGFRGGNFNANVNVNNESEFPKLGK